MKIARPEPIEPAVCPFTVVVDTREQRPYTFEAVIGMPGHPGVPVRVSTVRLGLPVGDYTVFGLRPSILIERKSKADLYQSVVKRANFEGRLAAMSEAGHSAVVVEADYLDLLTDPPSRSKLHPRSLSRTLIAWSIRYSVRWWFVPGREAGEALTFRLLERFYLDRLTEGVEVDGTHEVKESIEVTQREDGGVPE